MKKQRITVTGTTYEDAVITCEYPSIGKKFVRAVRDYPRIVWEVFLPVHGAKQKFGDAKSGGTPAEKYAEVLLIDASLMEGEWERTATVDLTPRILEAVARIQGYRYDPEAGTITDPRTKKVATPTEEDVKVWGRREDVKSMRLKIAAERADARAEEADEEEIVVKFS